MKSNLIIAAAIGCTFPAIAQQTKVTWGQEEKKETSFHKFIPIENAGFFKISVDDNGSNPTLARYDILMSQKVKRQIVFEDKNEDLLNVHNIGGSMYLFTSVLDKDAKMYNYFAQKINAGTLVNEGRRIALGAIDWKKGWIAPDVKFFFSEDSSKFLFFASTPNVDKQNEKYFTGVYSSSMQLLWRKNIELPYVSTKVEELSPFVTNNGDLGLPVNVFEKNIERSDLTTEGRRVPENSCKILVFTKESNTPTETVVDISSKYIHTLTLVNDAGNNLLLFGMYKTKSSGKITGFFTTPFDSQAKTLKINQLNAFPADLVNQVANDEQGSDKDSDPGFSVLFSLKNTFKRTNGSIDYVLQYYRTRTSSGDAGFRPNGQLYTSMGATSYSFGDLIDININTIGKIIYTRVPRIAHQFVDWYGDVIPAVVGNKLLLFYNDDSKNLAQDIDKHPNVMYNYSKSDFTMAAIDEKGKLVRSVVYEQRDMEYCTLVHLCNIIGNNRLLLYGLKDTQKKDRVGILEIK